LFYRTALILTAAAEPEPLINVFNQHLGIEVVRTNPAQLLKDKHHEQQTSKDIGDALAKSLFG
jgi:hypothetical protein